jgi:hypothetical protein
MKPHRTGSPSITITRSHRPPSPMRSCTRCGTKTSRDTGFSSGPRSRGSKSPLRWRSTGPDRHRPGVRQLPVVPGRRRAGRDQGRQGRHHHAVIRVHRPAHAGGQADTDDHRHGWRISGRRHRRGAGGARRVAHHGWPVEVLNPFPPLFHRRFPPFFLRSPHNSSSGSTLVGRSRGWFMLTGPGIG